MTIVHDKPREEPSISEQLRQLINEIEANSRAIAILNEKQWRQVHIVKSIAKMLEEENPDGPETPQTS